VFFRWNTPFSFLLSVFHHLNPICFTHDGAVKNHLAAALLLASMSAGLKHDRTGDYQMLAALEINFALWGMIGCAVMQTAQFFG
jgi:hypothetical protein